MITLRLHSDTLFQVRKNHLTAPLAAGYVLRFSGVANKKNDVIKVSNYQATEYHNFFLFTIDTQTFKALGQTANLRIVNPDGSIVFESEITVTDSK
jgi:hypothetical protein